MPVLEVAAATRVSRRKIIFGLGLIVAFGTLIFGIPPAFGKEINPVILFSAFVLVSVYVVLSFEFLHRTTVALIGAVSIIAGAIVLGSLQAEESFDFIITVIDFNTIGLLLGMMIIVAVLADTGVFQWVGIKASKITKGNLWKLLFVLCTFTAIVSMFIDNVTTILLMIPVTIAVFRTLKISPMPFILAQALASNVGGTASLIGDPPNIMIGSAANIDFSTFIIHMGPTVAVSFIASLFLLRFFFRNELKASVQNIEELMKEDESLYLKDKNLLKKSLIVLLAVIALFVVHGSINIEPSVIALGGAAFLLVITRASPERVFHEIDWPILIFFTGLFVIVGTAEHAGMIGLLSEAALKLTGGDPWITFFVIVWLSAFASAFIDNIPYTATMIPFIQTISLDPNITAAFGGYVVSPLWWGLSLGANFGGNGTLIGSSAGVVSAGISEKNGHPISFNRWFRVGFPFMIMTTAIGTLILVIDIMFRL
jgi:Na+/H+ antiporter NhaD/arsenite permease-like protein